MNGRDHALAKANAKARLRRGMFLLPSLFTVGNIAAGFFSITETIKAIRSEARIGRPSWRRANPSGLGGHRHRLRHPLRRARRPHRTHDQYHQRVRQGAGFAGRRHHLWRRSQSAGPYLGLPFSARLPSTRSCISTCSRPEPSSVFCFSSAGSRGWRGSISATMPSRAIRAGRDRKYFVGMPIPAAAGILASTVHLCYGIPIDDCWRGGSPFPGSSWWACAGS